MEVNTFKQTFCNLGFGIHTRGGVNSSVDASAPSKSCANINYIYSKLVSSPNDEQHNCLPHAIQGSHYMAK